MASVQVPCNPSARPWGLGMGSCNELFLSPMAKSKWVPGKRLKAWLKRFSLHIAIFIRFRSQQYMRLRKPAP